MAGDSETSSPRRNDAAGQKRGITIELEWELGPSQHPHLPIQERWKLVYQPARQEHGALKQCPLDDQALGPQALHQLTLYGRKVRQSNHHERPTAGRQRRGLR